jgi:hypothetical protein
MRKATVAEEFRAYGKARAWRPFDNAGVESDIDIILQLDREKNVYYGTSGSDSGNDGMRRARTQEQRNHSDMKRRKAIRTSP